VDPLLHGNRGTQSQFGKHSRIDAKAIVTANGGSDLIHIVARDRALAREVADHLTRQDYVSGLFVDSAFGEIPGALPLSAIGLEGTAQPPRPPIVVNFRTFSTDSRNRVMNAVQLADSTLQEGQGIHGGLSRDETFINAAAMGPDCNAGPVIAACDLMEL
jgi:hypothetical protein